MKRFVLDASYAMSWAFHDERTPARDAAQDSLADGKAQAVTPGLFSFEIANVLLVAERKGRLTRVQTEEFAAMMGTLAITLADSTLAATFDLTHLARQHQLTIYDTSYLRLALNEGLPLATLDGSLQKAAKKCGVSLIES